MDLERSFRELGFVVVRGLLADSVDWLTDEHAAVFDDLGIVHDGSRRTSVVPLPDQRPRLSSLLDDERITGLVGAVLGPDFNYLPGHGDWFSGDSGWHADLYSDRITFAKLLIYLTPLTGETGSIRFLPGSHLWTDRTLPEARFGVEGRDVPAVVVASEPGDVILFDHNIFHASYGGARAKPALALNFSRRAVSDLEVEGLTDYIAHHSREDYLVNAPAYWTHHRLVWAADFYGAAMVHAADAARMGHLQQPLDIRQRVMEGTRQVASGERGRTSGRNVLERSVLGR